MKLIFNYLIIILVASIYSGCATVQGYHRMLQRWQGEDVDKLVNAWGYPSKEIKSPNGNRVLVYVEESSYQYTPVDFSGQPDEVSTYSYNQYDNTVSRTTNRKPAMQTYTINSNCTTYFEIDDILLTILRTSFKGNDCTYAETPSFLQNFKR